MANDWSQSAGPTRVHSGFAGTDWSSSSYSKAARLDLSSSPVSSLLFYVIVIAEEAEPPPFGRKIGAVNEDTLLQRD
ncbi:hypothetical protein Ddc_01105 [Ditylenchus destructor]|nr:hypothetical protein Ddc_01105 [Ditylenchus destructor]